MTTPDNRSAVPWRGLVVIAIIGLAVIAWWRVGLLDLPSVPSDLTLQESGLAELEAMKATDDFLRTSVAQSAPGESPGAKLPVAPSPAAQLVRDGMVTISKGDAAAGLEQMRKGLRLEPANLVLANAYRLECFRLRRQFLLSAAGQSNIAPTFPPYLDKEPIAFFEALAGEHPSRETKLHLALAWVDLMLLFPALEIKAPASVEAVNILSSVLDGADPNFVPALFARGMNHLHRPARLVWPEADKYSPDSAGRDLARCIAVGRKFGAGSKLVQARLAIALGDAYVKAGRLGNARSWWQIAQNLSGDGSVQQAVRRRYAWRDEEALDRLEEELDRARSQLDQPMTDLAMMWN